MKALSILQPWAVAVALGIKRIENRTWGATGGGPGGAGRVQPQRLVIHTGKGRDLLTPERAKWFGVFVPEMRYPAEFEFGVLLGTVDVVEVTTSRYRAVQRAELKGGVAQGRFADAEGKTHYWVLQNARAFARPVPFRGALGLFDVPDELVEEAERASPQSAPAMEHGTAAGGLFPQGGYR